MANPYKGEVEIEFDGEMYDAHFTTNDLVTLEENLGQGFANLFGDQMGVRVIREVLFLIVRKEHPKITREKIGDAMDLSKIEEYVATLSTVIQTALGKGAEGGGDSAPLNQASA